MKRLRACRSNLATWRRKRDTKCSAESLVTDRGMAQDLFSCSAVQVLQNEAETSFTTLQIRCRPEKAPSLGPVARSLPLEDSTFPDVNRKATSRHQERKGPAPLVMGTSSGVCTGGSSFCCNSRLQSRKFRSWCPTARPEPQHRCGCKRQLVVASAVRIFLRPWKNDNALLGKVFTVVVCVARRQWF